MSNEQKIVYRVETDVLNTVQYSNHVGYGSFAGEKLTGEQIWALLEGMHANGLLKPSRVLTGYMGSVEAVRAVAFSVVVFGTLVGRRRRGFADVLGVCALGWGFGEYEAASALLNGPRTAGRPYRARRSCF